MTYRRQLYIIIIYIMRVFKPMIKLYYNGNFVTEFVIIAFFFTIKSDIKLFFYSNYIDSNLLVLFIDI